MKRLCSVNKVFPLLFEEDGTTPKPKLEEIIEDQSRSSQALRTLHLKKSDVLALNLRDGRMVVVTKNGQKLTA